MCRILFLCSVAPIFQFYYMNDWCQHQSFTEDTFGERLRGQDKSYIGNKKEMLLFSSWSSSCTTATSRPSFEKRKIIGKGMMPIRKWMNNTLLLMLRHSFIDGTTPLWPSIPHHIVSQGTSYTYPALMLLRPDTKIIAWNFVNIYLNGGRRRSDLNK